jgi:hypothetical protein
MQLVVKDYWSSEFPLRNPNYGTADPGVTAESMSSVALVVTARFPQVLR